MTRDFVLILASDEYEEAYNLTSVSFKEKYDLQYLQDLASGNSVLDEAIGLDIIDYGYEEGLYLIYGEIVSDSGRLPVFMTVGKNDAEEWKVLFFSIDPADMPSEEVDNADDGDGGFFTFWLAENESLLLPDSKTLEQAIYQFQSERTFMLKEYGGLTNR